MFLKAQQSYTISTRDVNDRRFWSYIDTNNEGNINLTIQRIEPCTCPKYSIMSQTLKTINDKDSKTISARKWKRNINPTSDDEALASLEHSIAGIENYFLHWEICSHIDADGDIQSPFPYICDIHNGIIDRLSIYQI